MIRTHAPLDAVLALACRALATLSDAVPASRPVPAEASGVGGQEAPGAVPPGAGDATAQGLDQPTLSETERRLSGALMRVNHVGEICAQALYEGQAASTPDASLREHFLRAAREEADHLVWTRTRLTELDACASRLNPLWYAGALALGVLAGRAGDRWSLGFMAETERQVESHLQSHLERLPAKDQRSRRIVEAMQLDEVAHARSAVSLGAAELPQPVKGLMRGAARVMTAVAHRF